MRKLLSFLYGFKLGFLFGGLMVLLTTPQSGEEFRGQAQAWLNIKSDEWRKLREERRSQLQEQFVDLKHGLNK